MSRIAKNFSAQASNYDEAVFVQPLVAAHLAERLQGRPARILEIGCGTGGLSAHLAEKFPGAELVLTDISASMLNLCEERIGKMAHFHVMDGAHPDAGLGQFDLIASSLAMQWFEDLQGGISNLLALLKPGGVLGFAVLGEKNFKEWQDLLAESGIQSGLHAYPSMENFLWPEGYEGRLEEEFIAVPHANGQAFLKSLKRIGAGAPRAGYSPLPPSSIKHLLAQSSGGFTATYHVLYGMLKRKD